MEKKREKKNMLIVFYIFIKIKYKYLFFYSMVIGLSIFIQNEIFMNIVIENWSLNKDHNKIAVNVFFRTTERMRVI